MKCLIPFILFFINGHYNCYSQGIIGVGARPGSQENCYQYYIKTGFLHQPYPNGLPEDGKGYDEMEARLKSTVSGTTDVIIYSYQKNETAVVYSFAAKNTDGYNCEFSGYIVGIGYTKNEAIKAALKKKDNIDNVLQFNEVWASESKENYIESKKIESPVINYGGVKIKYTYVKTQNSEVIIMEAENTTLDSVTIKIETDQDPVDEIGGYNDNKVNENYNIVNVKEIPLKPKVKIQTKLTKVKFKITVDFYKNTTDESTSMLDIIKKRIKDEIKCSDGKIKYKYGDSSGGTRQ